MVLIGEDHNALANKLACRMARAIIKKDIDHIVSIVGQFDTVRQEGILAIIFTSLLPNGESLLPLRDRKIILYCCLPRVVGGDKHTHMQHGV